MTRPHPLTPRTDQTLALMPKVELLLPPAKSPKQVKSKASLGGESKVENLTKYCREFNRDRGALVKKAIEASEAWDGWDWSDSEHPQMFLAPSLGQVGGIENPLWHLHASQSHYLLGKLTNTTNEVVVWQSICVIKTGWNPYYYSVGWIPKLVWRKGNSGMQSVYFVFRWMKQQWLPKCCARLHLGMSVMKHSEIYIYLL